MEYNYIDYRFKNNTDVPVQICVWSEKGQLHCELRAEKRFEYKYDIEETDCYFEQKNGKYFKNSKLYRVVSDFETGKIMKREKLFDNHSEVMYDEKLIPKELIRKK